MIKITYFGKAEDGEFVHEAPEIFRGHMHQLEEGGKRLEMTVKVHRAKRSTGQDHEAGNQNGYYWAVVVRMVADEIGELDQDQVHQWLQMVADNIKHMPDGTKIPIGTSQMDTKEFEEYLSRVRIWAATPGNLCEQGFYIPLPNEAPDAYE